ncbi:hypothetical protein GCM10027427_35670 [Pseudoclavibacter terrae]
MLVCICEGFLGGTKILQRVVSCMFASLAEYERELHVERVDAGIAAARQNATRFRRPLSDPCRLRRSSSWWRTHANVAERRK